MWSLGKRDRALRNPEDIGAGRSVKRNEGGWALSLQNFAGAWTSSELGRERGLETN